MDQEGDRTGSFVRIGTRLAVLAAILLLYHGIDSGSLIPSDDSIYTRAAIEGARAGRLIDVTWMGHVLFEKGPLLFGAIQLGGLFGGPVEQQARFPGIVAGVLMLLLIYRIARDLGLSMPAAMVSAAFCLSTNLFYFNARRPMTDIPGMMLALAGFRTFLVSRDSKRTFAAGLLFGLSSLCKLTAPIPFIAAAAVLKIIRDRSAGGQSPAVMARAFMWCLIGMAVAMVPWHAAMTIAHGREFLDTYFGYHLFQRVSQSVEGAGAAETYVGWMLSRDLAATVVLAAVIPVTVILAVRKNAAALTALTLFFFTALLPAVSSTALPHYIVPVLPGVALAVGLGADRLIGLFRDRTILRVVTACAAIAITGIVFAATNLDDLRHPDYSHDSRALCEIMRDDGSAARIAGTFDLHDTAIPLYCDMDMKFFGFNPGYHAAVHDTPMLKGTYVPFDRNMADDLADTGEMLVCDATGLVELKAVAEKSGLAARVREFGTRFAVTFARP